MKIQAQVVADSLSPQKNRLTTLLLTFPRFILAELNTHRMLSKNSASSRAIPFKVMVNAVKTNPFIPIAWQMHHPGMQGTEYLTAPVDIAYAHDLYLAASKDAIKRASQLYNLGGDQGVTKQLCNRLLEPFMWHTVLISGIDEGWENFFELRCPQYTWAVKGKEPIVFRSRKDVIAHLDTIEAIPDKNERPARDWSDIEWLEVNKGQAEIHMMALAEAIWDAMNESTPKQLQPGGWHIPFEDKIAKEKLFPLTMRRAEGIEGNPTYQVKDALMYPIKIATAMAARTSYTVVGDEKEISYERLIDIHDRMAVQKPFHASPFEHCSRCMSDEEYYSFIRGQYPTGSDRWGIFNQERYPIFETTPNPSNPDIYGWCRNYRGFIQYRHILETGGTL